MKPESFHLGFILVLGMRGRLCTRIIEKVGLDNRCRAGSILYPTKLQAARGSDARDRVRSIARVSNASIPSFKRTFHEDDDEVSIGFVQSVCLRSGK